MRIIVAGGRDFYNKEVAFRCLNSLKLMQDDIIVSGHAKGADTLGEEYAKVCRLKTEIYPANWAKYGKKAGPIRNIQMAEVADALVVFWNGFSKGTRHMIEEATKRHLRIVAFDYNGNIINLTKSQF